MQKPILNNIHHPGDLKKLNIGQLTQLAEELRTYIIDEVSTKEGHLGASLGVIELTLALHYVFDTPNDLLVWDVGHQAYAHKIITGRRQSFLSNRQWGGISGFPKREESLYDAFGTGHSSTAISAVLGMALASQLNQQTARQHIAVVGDASIASGMAFEGLNHAGVTQANMLIVLNDNAIGIDPSVGALKNYLTKVKKGENPPYNNIIEALNIPYSGPVDGHDLKLLIKTFQHLKKKKGPRFLHIITTKGKGLPPAELDQVRFHAPGKFDKATGAPLIDKDRSLPPKFQEVFGETLLELAQNDKDIIGITPAMPTGSSLKIMMDILPERAFDVGIAEQHAVTLAAGMATQGKKVFCNIYSTFLQRAYDQIIHDVALQNLPVIFCLDRAGLVGEDGPTHHGAFDLAYLRCIPNMKIFAPLDEVELRNILFTASCGLSGPLAIRYPRGRGLMAHWKKPFEKLGFSARCLQKGTEIAILSTGHIGQLAAEAITLTGKSKSRVSHWHFGFVKPLDTKTIEQLCETHSCIITVEDGCLSGGFGSAVLECLQEKNIHLPVSRLGLPDDFVPHGPVEKLYDFAGISPKKIADEIKRRLKTIPSK